MKQQSKLGFSLIELSIVILIIGILVIGVTKGSRIISEARLKSARSLTISSPVNSIPGLLLWIDSVSDKSFDTAETSDQSSVTNWYDINSQSSTKYNFSQSTAGYRPTYVRNGINSIPALSFDGSDDLMNSANVPATSFFNNAQNTVFVVTKVTSGSVILGYMLNGSNKYSIGHNSTYLRVITPASSLLGSTNIISKPIIISVVKGPATKTVFINGVQDVSGTDSIGFPIPSFNAQISLGAQYDNQFHSQSYIGEVIIFSRALSTSEKRSVESYLSQKWGIKLS